MLGDIKALNECGVPVVIQVREAHILFNTQQAGLVVDLPRLRIYSNACYLRCTCVLLH
ncbi:Uncharacterised protein [Vibrio cholerae]|nr:Uncharacterised protein [Vibrio cholerae]